MELLPARRQPLTISLTSLIDVVFILLMFFMLTSSFTPLRALELQDGAGEADGAEEATLLLLDRHGELFTAAGLPVTDLGQLQPPLVLAAVGDTRVQQLVTAMERLQQAGLQVSLGDSLPASALAGARP